MLRATVLGLTVLTGFSGLVYEVAWQRYLATLLGSHSEATAAVLALFLGGLSLGYSLFGRLTRSVVNRSAARGEPPRLLLLYGAVEATIGLHALLFPWLFGLVSALSLAIPHRADGTGFALDVLLAALLILPSSVLMGGTIPVLTQALARSLADATRVHALIYAFNTAGAFAGALAGGLVLVPWLGLQRVVLSMGVINLAAGTSFALLGLRGRAAFAAPAAQGPPLRLGVYAAVALLVGFAAITLETVLIRVGGLSMGSSQFAFAMVVAVFVLCIALGSFAVSALPRIGTHLLLAAQWTLAALLLALYPALQNAPWAVHIVRGWFRDLDGAFYPYQIAVFLGALAVLAVPVGLSGATLPLLFHRLRREVGDLGSAAGRLYAWNTVGSMLGALVGGYLLFFWLDLDSVYLVALGAVVTAAALLTIRALDMPRTVSLLLCLGPLLAGIALLPRWDSQRLVAAAFRVRQPMPEARDGPARFFQALRGQTRVVFYDDDPNSTVSVIEAPLPGREPDHGISTNGKPDGSLHTDYPTMAMAALLPSLFADAPRSAFVIGFGTGVTVGEFTALHSVERVRVAEISPGVIEAGRFFEDGNQGALGSPKTEVVVSDAYRALLRSQEHFDMIASEPSNPWVSGVEMLFSREFLEAARDRLNPGGVYAQWFHLYENDDDVVELVLRTYIRVFDQVAVWYALGPDILLLGFRSPEHAADLDRLEARAAQPDFAAGLRRAGIDSFGELLAHEMIPLGLVNAADLPGEVHTLLHPVLSLRAARAFFRGGASALPPLVTPELAALGTERSMVHRWLARQGEPPPEDAYAALTGEACGGVAPQVLICPTYAARWLRDYPDSTRRQTAMRSYREHPVLRTALDAPFLASLAELFAPDGPELASPARDRTPTPERARELTNLYIHYFQYGTPFSREAIARVWSRCRDGANSRGACEKGLAHAESRLGPLRRAARGGEGRRSAG